jgi:hypothetical protein
LGILLKIVLTIFKINIWTSKVIFLNLGWQPCFHRTGTIQGNGKAPFFKILTEETKI